MKYLAVINSALAIVAMSLLTGCGEGSMTLPAFPIPDDDSSTYQAPTNCVNLSGRWQMNSSYFSFDQTKCEKMTHTNLVTNATLDFVADKIDRDYILSNGNTLREMSYFTQTQFILDQVTTSTAGVAKQVTRKYYLSKKPCDLMNPDEEEYLTVDIHINGEIFPSQCDFWAKNK